MSVGPRFFWLAEARSAGTVLRLPQRLLMQTHVGGGDEAFE
jgi:hypothetical protein